MTCRDCGNKSKSRHEIKSAPLAQSIEEAKAAIEQEHQMNPMDPMAALIAAKKMSYEDITERKLMQQRMLMKQSEAMYAEMTEAMRRVHVDELISVVNHSRFSLPGMTSGQAIVALHDILAREEFSFISDIYPGLREAVGHRYAELKDNLLPGPEHT
jgi:hypothetical protein